MGNIRIFGQNATDFSGLGLGIVPDVISCTVTEERNGIFELEMEYPKNGLRSNEMLLRGIIVCKPNPYDSPQAFRIYSVSKEFNGNVKINAQHISYDLSDVIIKTGEASVEDLDPSDIWNGCVNGLAESFSISPFTFSTDLTTSDSIPDSKGNYLTEWFLKGPKSMRNLILGSEADSILTNYIGSADTGDEPEYSFNNYAITLSKSRGTDRGFTIAYSKNMTGFSQEESLDKIFTHVYPYYYAENISYSKGGDSDGEQVTKEDFTVDLSDWTGGSYSSTPLISTGIKDDDGHDLPFRRVLPLDCSNLYSDEFAVTFHYGNGIVKYDQQADAKTLDSSVVRYDFVGDQTVEKTVYLVGFRNDLDYGMSYETKYFKITGQLGDHFEVSFADDRIYCPDAFDPPGTWPHTKLRIHHTGSSTGSFTPDDVIAHIEGDNDIDSEASKYIDLDDVECIDVGCQQIEKAAKRYIAENRLSRFPVQLTVDIADDPTLLNLNVLKLCDKVKIYYPDLHITTSAKCTKTTYDVILNRYTSLDFSNAFSDLAFSTAKTMEILSRMNRNIGGLVSGNSYLTWKDNF